MDSLLSGAKLSEELDFVKRHAESLAQNKRKYPPSFVPPVSNRPKKAPIVPVPVCEPPAAAASEDEPQGAETISLTIKSLKPPLIFTLPAPSTATIATLKSLLSKQESTAPPPEAQRWILKGKAMGDGKLLKEFAVQDGALVNLMVSKVAATPTAAIPTEAPSEGVPSLTLSSGEGPAPLSIAIPDSAFDPAKPTRENKSGESNEFLDKVSSPQLWIDALELLRKQFGEADARKVWESWLSGSQDYLSPSEKALIRSKTGISAMGGL